MNKYLSLGELFDLSGKTAIVTGGTKGIGFGIARRLAEAGAAVLLAATDVERGKQAIAELEDCGYRAAFIKCDVTKVSDIDNMIETAIRTFDSVDIMVNNAGVFPFRPFLDVDEEFWCGTMDVNLKGTFFGCLRASAQMVKQGRGGSIINISSISAFWPDIGHSVYDASKAGILMMTKTIAKEMAQYGIRVNAICPGTTMTEGLEPVRDLVEKAAQRIPLGFCGQPTDIANAALFLASPASNYLTGTHILADGGLLLS